MPQKSAKVSLSHQMPMKWGLKLTEMEWTLESFQSRRTSPARTGQISLQSLYKLCSLYSWRQFVRRSALWVAESKMFLWWPVKEIPLIWNAISSRPMSNRHWSLFSMGPLWLSMCQGPLLLARGEEFHHLNPRARHHDWFGHYGSWCMILCCLYPSWLCFWSVVFDCIRCFADDWCKILSPTFFSWGVDTMSVSSDYRLYLLCNTGRCITARIWCVKCIWCMEMIHVLLQLWLLFVHNGH